MNQQRIFVNEHSVVGQASNEYVAGELIGILADVLRALTRHIEQSGRPQSMTTSNHLSSRPLINTPDGEVSFLECLFKRRGPDQQAVRGLVQKLMSNGPYSEELLAADIGHHCERQVHEQISVLNNTSIAAAAALKGWVVSLRNCDDYDPETIVVTFQLGEGEKRVVTLPHFIEPDHLRQVKRVYEHNVKHKRNATHNSGVRISGMDLNPDTAQEALNSAIELIEEDRLFSKHSDAIYVFFEHTPQHYHGYRVDNPYEYQHRDAKIFNDLCRCGWLKR